MKTLRDVQKFIFGLIQSGAPLRDSGLGEQSYNCDFIEPYGSSSWMIPHIRIFGTKPVTLDSDITSAAINIGKSSESFRERDTTSQMYFGRKFRELESEVSKIFDCKIDQACQIKCKDTSSVQAFIRLLIKYYDETQGRNENFYRSKERETTRKNETSTILANNLENEDNQKDSTIDNLIDNLDDAKINAERQKILKLIAARCGQAEFRQSLLDAYKSRCAISGCSVPDVLEAAHIIPYSESMMDHVRNGILLRSDLHNLFDKGLIAISDDFKVLVHESIKNSAYGKIEGKKVNVPQSNAERPSKKALKWHYDNVFKKASSQ